MWVFCLAIYACVYIYILCKAQSACVYHANSRGWGYDPQEISSKIHFSTLAEIKFQDISELTTFTDKITTVVWACNVLTK